MKGEFENPLCTAIFERLCNGRSWKIHTLACDLESLPTPGSLDENQSKDLFKRNFLIMNALYQLQDELASSGYQIHISALEITLSKAENDSVLVAAEPLKTYYLDWQNYDTSSEQIEELLDSFWQRMAGMRINPGEIETTTAELLSRWELPRDCTRKQLNKRWRKLALSCHPDRNTGDKRHFQRLEKEYNQLKRLFT